MDDYRTESYKKRTESIASGEQTDFEKRKNLPSASTIKDYNISSDKGVITYTPKETVISNESKISDNKPSQSVIDIFRGTKTSQVSPQEASNLSQMSLRDDVAGYYVSVPNKDKGVTQAGEYSPSYSYLESYKGTSWEGYGKAVASYQLRQEKINTLRYKTQDTIATGYKTLGINLKDSWVGNVGLNVLTLPYDFSVGYAGTAFLGYEKAYLMGRALLTPDISGSGKINPVKVYRETSSRIESTEPSIYSGNSFAIDLTRSLKSSSGRKELFNYAKTPEGFVTSTALVVGSVYGLNVMRNKILTPKAGTSNFVSYESMGNYKIEGSNVKVNVLKSGVIKQEVITGLQSSYRYFDVMGGGKEAGLVFIDGGKYNFKITNSAVIKEFKPSFVTSELGLYDAMPKNYIKNFYSFESGKGFSVMTETGGFGNIKRNTLIYEVGKGKGFESRTLRIANNNLGVNIESSKLVYNSKPFVSQSIFQNKNSGFKYLESGKFGTSVSYGERLFEVEGLKPGVTSSYKSFYNSVLDIEMLGNNVISNKKIIYADLSKTRVPASIELTNKIKGGSLGTYYPFSDKIVLSKTKITTNPLFKDNNINVYYHELAHANFARRTLTDNLGFYKLGAELFEGRIKGKPSMYEYNQVRSYYRSLGYESKPASIINEEFYADLSSKYIDNLKKGTLSKMDNIPKTRSIIGNYYGNYEEANIKNLIVVKQTKPTPIKAGILYQQSIGLNDIELTGFRKSVASSLKSGSSKVNFEIDNKIVKTGFSNKPLYDNINTGSGGTVQQTKISTVSDPAIGSGINFENLVSKTTKTLVEYKTLSKTKTLLVPLKTVNNEQLSFSNNRIINQINPVISLTSEAIYKPNIINKINPIVKVDSAQKLINPQVQKQELSFNRINLTFNPVNPIPITPPENPVDKPFPFFPSGAGGGKGFFSKSFGVGKITKYVPSFSALVFGIKGSYKKTSLSKSGMDFRPITKNIKLTTGNFNTSYFG